MKDSNKAIKLTVSQQKVFDDLCDFVKSKTDRIFILKGYAGTGKTTMMHFLVDYLNQHKRLYRLLAPTGRAAKVLRDLSGGQANTIHSMLYTYSDFNQDVTKIQDNVGFNGQLLLVFEATTINPENQAETIYIVDEASMVADKEQQDAPQAQFGSGRVLSELLDYDTRKGSKFIFIGDPCQLPPVNETDSPALSAQYFENRKMKVREQQLTEIIRQSGDNSIVMASQKIRGLYKNAPSSDIGYNRSKTWGPKLPFRGCKDIIIHPNADDMLNDYLQRIDGKHFNDATYICRGNATCDQTAQFVRKRLGFNVNHIVQKDDLLLVIQNNNISGLVNGDMVQVVELTNLRTSRAGLNFIEAKVRELASGKEFSQLLLENTISQSTLNLTGQQQTALFLDFILRMKNKGINPKKHKDIFDEHLRYDPYLNALRCKYGYAITCHKAQGGEWNDVYVAIPRNITLNPTKASYQWVYTAITRAKQRLHVVQDFFIE